MRQIEIPLTSSADGDIERAIDESIADAGLRVTLRGSLRQYAGCIHWHVKRGDEPGTLEITFWPREHRAWFSIQDGRTADWIDDALMNLASALQRRLIEA